MTAFFSILKCFNLSLSNRNFIILKHVSPRGAAPPGREHYLQGMQADSRPAPSQHLQPKPPVFNRFLQIVLQIPKYPLVASTDVIYRARLSLKTPFRELEFSVVLVSSKNRLCSGEGGHQLPLIRLHWLLSMAHPWQMGKSASNGFLVSLAPLWATSAFLLALFPRLSHCVTPVPDLPWLGFQCCLPSPP